MIMSTRIYFDNSATTPLDPRVREAMLPFLDNIFGNPSSMHLDGLEARQAVEYARGQLADLIGAGTDEIVFTASGTEASNLALAGFTRAQPPGCHIITTAIEHPAVLMACRALERSGVAITRLPVGGDGIVDPAALAVALRPTTRLVSVMAANNVWGPCNPLRNWHSLPATMGRYSTVMRCRRWGRFLWI